MTKDETTDTQKLYHKGRQGREGNPSKNMIFEKHSLASFASLAVKLYGAFLCALRVLGGEALMFGVELTMTFQRRQT
jgi:hypothetical protein